jgi:hypothetical protein
MERVFDALRDRAYQALDVGFARRSRFGHLSQRITQTVASDLTHTLARDAAQPVAQPIAHGVLMLP